MADKTDPVAYAKYIRNQPSTERLLRQFLTMETGQGKNEAYVNSPVWCKCGRMNSESDEHQRTCADNIIAPGISKTEGIVGGRARLAGSRMPVCLLVQMLGSMSDDEILFAYPWMEPYQLEDALRYEADHKEEIAKDISEYQKATTDVDAG